VPVPALLAFIADFINPNDPPPQTGDFGVSPVFFIILFGLGFVVGIIGHLAKSRLVVGLGILLVFLATVLIPIALSASH
jgi:hypothetical protein